MMFVTYVPVRENSRKRSTLPTVITRRAFVPDREIVFCRAQTLTFASLPIPASASAGRRIFRGDSLWPEANLSAGPSGSVAHDTSAPCVTLARYEKTRPPRDERRSRFQRGGISSARTGIRCRGRHDESLAAGLYLTGGR